MYINIIWYQWYLTIGTSYINEKSVEGPCLPLIHEAPWSIYKPFKCSKYYVLNLFYESTIYKIYYFRRNRGVNMILKIVYYINNTWFSIYCSDKEITKVLQGVSATEWYGYHGLNTINAVIKFVFYIFKYMLRAL